MRRTKIVCTLGPASNDERILKDMMLSGLDAARFNFSHGDHKEQLKRVNKVKELREKFELPIPLILDTKGPEIRTGLLEGGNKLKLEKGSRITLTADDVEGNNNKISISYKNLYLDVEPGAKILIDDGLIELDVIDIKNGELECVVLNGGVLGERKGINVPGASIKLPTLTEKDINDIKFGVENGFDYIAASFIRKKDDVLEIRELLEKLGGEDIDIIAKIENEEGVRNIDGILDVSDGIMVARGDLGVEIPYEEIPTVQKMLITKANEKKKIVITATQMLDSMIKNPRPTRAETTDVANAIFDGTDAVMLSGETAAGDYPVESVKAMAKIASKAENTHIYMTKCEVDFHHDITDTIARSARMSANTLGAEGIICVSETGRTPKKISKNRPHCKIIAFTLNEKIYRKLALVWGCYPKRFRIVKGFEQFVDFAVNESKDSGHFKKDDIVIITAGVPIAQQGTTNLMKIVKV